MKIRKILLIGVIVALGYIGYKDDPQKEISNKESQARSVIEFGELLDVNYSGGVDGKTIVIKAKIKPNLTNKMTIHQNYINIAYFVEHNPDLEYDSIDYWAIADMESGKEGKVISFTVNKETIEGLKNQTIFQIDLEDYLDDLWILPSLLK